MTYYAVQWSYTTDTATIAEARQPHVDYLKVLVDSGQVPVAGGWVDGTGGLVVFDVESREELEPLLADDPFTTAGVIVDTAIHEWRVALGTVGAQ